MTNDETSGGAATEPARTVPRPVYAAATTVGAAAMFLMMASSRQLPHGPLLGMVALAVTLFGLLGLLGLLAPREGATVVPSTVLFGREGEPRWAAPIVTVPLAMVILFVGIGVGGYATLPAVIVASLLALLPSTLHRPGLLVAVIVSLLYLPLLGAYGLWDPWETHYGEVAREMLARDDWISLWWAQEDWFWSKPILIFWAEALSMGAVGITGLPDSNPANPEWALRLPIFLLSLFALLSIFASVRRVFGARAGVLAALVVASTPHFFLLAHQSITDMPLVACLVVSMGFLVHALLEDPEREPTAYRVGPFTVSLQTAIVALVLAIALPQALYLITRNVTIFADGVSVHPDVFRFGSAGNWGVPGNKRPEDVVPGGFEPAGQGAMWLVLLAGLVFLLRRERKVQGFQMAGFYVFCALGLMAKGIPGFALQGLIALFYLVASRRWALLSAGRLRIGLGLLLVPTLGLPWYVAMTVRHGAPFLDRILVHDHINRLAAGVHGDNGSIDYFIGQLGYGTFPWTGLMPLSLVAFLWMRPRDRGEGPTDPALAPLDLEREWLTIIALWVMTAFTLFNAMITKFHHYIFPVVPPAGMLAGVLLDRFWGAREERTSAAGIASNVVALASTGLLIVGIAGAIGNPRGVIPDLPPGQTSDWVLHHPWPTWAWALPLGAGLLGLALAGFGLHRRGLDRPTVDEGRALALGVGAVGGAILVAFVGRDMSWAPASRPHGFERMIQLFVYMYQRPWPAHLDYRPILTALALVSGLAIGFMAFVRLRALFARVLLGAGLALTIFAVDVYLPDLAEHWSSHLLVKRYYEIRRGPEEPLIAYQMNWKGENFYTGNRVNVFQDLDATRLRTWIRENGGRTTYAVLEHTRLSSFRALFPMARVEELSTARENNKFVLVRVQL